MCEPCVVAKVAGETAGGHKVAPLRNADGASIMASAAVVFHAHPSFAVLLTADTPKRFIRDLFNVGHGHVDFASNNHRSLVVGAGKQTARYLLEGAVTGSSAGAGRIDQRAPHKVLIISRNGRRSHQSKSVCGHEGHVVAARMDRFFTFGPWPHHTCDVPTYTATY